MRKITTFELFSNHRYVRNHDERRNAKGDKEKLKKLDLQCKGLGFFQVII
jgi:hypothetical protein